ncbi:UNVERIFIED_CONTAM: hypothetical protein GTU68_022553 [Idotea baltica]|nr:hypothetical protein [Idotea baltica]
MRHAPFKIGQAERDRWLKLMNEAMEDVQLDPLAQQHLKAFFTNVADFMRNVDE